MSIIAFGITTAVYPAFSLLIDSDSIGSLAFYTRMDFNYIPISVRWLLYNSLIPFEETAASTLLERISTC